MDRVVTVDLAEQDDELLAAEAADKVAGAGGRAQRIGDGDEDGIAGQVTEPVVDPLEVVDVDDENGQWAIRAPDPQNLAFGDLMPVGRVGQPGLVVGTGSLEEFRVQEAALE